MSGLRHLGCSRYERRRHTHWRSQSWRWHRLQTNRARRIQASKNSIRVNLSNPPGCGGPCFAPSISGNQRCTRNCIAKATLVNPVSSLARAAPDPERAPQARCEQSARVGSVGCLVQAIPATTSRSVQPAKSAFWTALNYTARSAGATRGMCPRFGKFLHKRRQDLTFPTSKRFA